MLRERMVLAWELSLEEAAEKAWEFLRKREYLEMVPISTEEFRNVAIISLARKSGETILQPETIKVQVALDNGEILGMEAIPHLTFRDLSASSLPPALHRRKPVRNCTRVYGWKGVKRVVILNDRFQETSVMNAMHTSTKSVFSSTLMSSPGRKRISNGWTGAGWNWNNLQQTAAPPVSLKPGRAFFSRLSKFIL